ncbi:low molecular weight protein-tyrosine-phosphatase [Aquisalimonas sp.]|uniref:low molecular weight protein-tyrosine-phosphatase n=1 Tax=Aquisalimonas sp. TaxID=1872621 RepID=UPI0025B85899|nr:low molecular weight protein-tyrosine-phosphatase [Aquisalimonas sp.]
MNDGIKVRVLFVCMGNICRSPSAEAVFHKLLADHGLEGRIEADSAGTHAYHIGKPPDPRSQAAGRERGVEMGHLRARQVERSDFDYFDHILAMDQWNLDILLAEAPAGQRAKVRLLVEFAENHTADEVPDPYYGGDRGFEHVLDLIEDSATGLLKHLRQAHRL